MGGIEPTVIIFTVCQKNLIAVSFLIYIENFFATYVGVEPTALRRITRCFFPPENLIRNAQSLLMAGALY
jgi:hypothetical protein